MVLKYILLGEQQQQRRTPRVNQLLGLEGARGGAGRSVGSSGCGGVGDGGGGGRLRGAGSDDGSRAVVGDGGPQPDGGERVPSAVERRAAVSAERGPSRVGGGERESECVGGRDLRQESRGRSGGAVGLGRLRTQDQVGQVRQSNHRHRSVTHRLVEKREREEKRARGKTRNCVLSRGSVWNPDHLEIQVCLTVQRCHQVKTVIEGEESVSSQQKDTKKSKSRLWTTPSERAECDVTLYSHKVNSFHSSLLSEKGLNFYN